MNNPDNTYEILIATLYEDVIPYFQKRAKNDGKEIIFYPNDDNNIVIKTNPWCVKVVLFELLNNAFKYSRKDEPYIKLDVHYCEYTDSIEFIIEDNGIPVFPDPSGNYDWIF